MASILDIERHLCWKYVFDVQEICFPLFEAFNINYYDYARFYADGSCIMLFSDPQWVKTFLTEFSYQAPSGIIPAGPNLWNSYIPTDILRCASNEFNHNNGVTFLVESSEYKEIVNIAAPPENKSIENFYLNQHAFLQQFHSYFKNKAYPLIQKLEKSPLLLQPEMKVEQPISYERQFKKFMTLLDKLEQDFNLLLNQNTYVYDVRLTPRERECIKFFLQGMSAKVIARNMSISYRTVEGHIDNIKAKFNCKTRLQLLALFNAKF